MTHSYPTIAVFLAGGSKSALYISHHTGILWICSYRAIALRYPCSKGHYPFSSLACKDHPLVVVRPLSSPCCLPVVKRALSEARRIAAKYIPLASEFSQPQSSYNTCYLRPLTLAFCQSSYNCDLPSALPASF